MKIKAETTPIVRIGAIGDPRIGGGRLMPYIIVDCKNNKNLEQLIELHGETSLPGDVSCSWGWKRFDKSLAFLRLVFSQPMRCEINLQFPIQTQGYAVDWILEVNGLYLQSSKYGERASVGYGEPSILVEVPKTASFPVWPKSYRRALVKKFKKMGVARSEMEKAISDYKRVQRELWYRRPSSENSNA